MKKLVHDLSPLACFLITVGLTSLITYQLITFLLKILEATPGFQLMRGY